MMNKQSKQKKKEISNHRYLSSRELLHILNIIYRNRKFSLPRGSNAPRFSFEESQAILELLFFKPKNIILKIYERTPRKKELPLRRKVFISMLLGEAKFNGARAARMAGYSSRSAKQIAYNLIRRS